MTASILALVMVVMVHATAVKVRTAGERLRLIWRKSGVIACTIWRNSAFVA